MQMFSVENYTMDRAERCTQRKEPYGRYLQEADAVRRTVPVSNTWRIPHNDYCRGTGQVVHTPPLPFLLGKGRRSSPGLMNRQDSPEKTQFH